MAAEAARQVTGEVVELTGLRFKDISIKTALVVPDTKEGVEVSLSLLPVNESNLWQSVVWKWFRISSYNPSYDDWVEHCSGYISVEYVKSPPDPVDSGRERGAETQAWKTLMDQGVQVCQTPRDAGGIYANLDMIGLKYGPVFRNLSNVTVSGQRLGMTAGGARTPNLAETMPKGYIHPHLVHPATLDSFFVAGLIAIADHEGRDILRFPLVPTFIKEAWISTDTDSSAGARFRYYGKATAEAYNAYNFEMKCLDASADQPRMSLAGVRFTPLMGETASLGDSEKFGYTVDWVPDVNMLRTSEFRDQLTVEPALSYKEQQDVFEQLQLASLLLITDALRVLNEAPPSSYEGYLETFYEWMKRGAADLLTGSVPHVTVDIWRKYSEDEKLKAELYQTVAEGSHEGKLLIRLGVELAAVVQGKIDPLYLMFGQDDLMPRYYEEITRQGDSAKSLNRFLSLMGDNFEGLEILEVGAGTGGFTKVLLNTLAPVPEADADDAETSGKIAQYTFTDISPSFFSKAKEALEPWKDLLAFQKLDISTDPTTQGFSAAKYDVIIANNVLHATPDLQKTLQHCRLMLKPGGKLVITEGTRPDLIWPSLKFGLLPGWWLSAEPDRKWCPLLYTPQWDDYLRRSGFSGLDLEIPNSRYPEFAKLTTMVSTAVQDSEGKREDKVVILCQPSGVAHDLGSELVQALGIPNCTLMQPSELDGKDLTNAICVSLLELENPILPSLSEDHFQRIRNLLSTCKRLLWVTGDPAAEPKFSMSTGIIRTIRWERDADSPNLITLAAGDFDPSAPQQLVDAISKIFGLQFMTDQTRHKNAEYLVRNGLTYTGRIVRHPKATGFFSSQFSTPTPEMTLWKDIGRAVKLQNSTPGALNQLHWVTDTAAAAPLDDSEVEIDVRAVGLNFVDLLSVMGEALGDVIGREAAGVITRVGAGVENFKPGDRVVYLADSPKKGTFQSLGRANQYLVASIPDEMSFSIAAGLPVIYATVIYSLKNVGRLAAGEKILIHSAAGGVGQAAIQYSKEIGAEIFATVSTTEKREFLTTEYGIPEDHIFSSRDYSFVKGIMRMTGNEGVDVVLNSLSRDYLRLSWECVAPFGRFIEIGKKDLLAAGKLDMTPFLRNIMFAGVDLVSLAGSKPKIIRELLDETVRLWVANKIKGAYPTTTLTYSQLEPGLRMLQSGNTIGKVVFIPDESDIVPVISDVQTPYQFQPDASYVLAGGLGGLGRSLASWMVSRGAKHLIFLSRTGNITRPVQEMVSSLEGKGCKIRIFKCDVSDATSLRTVLEECAQTLPPIKGCVQGSMVLKVSNSEVFLDRRTWELTHRRTECLRPCHTQIGRQSSNRRLLARGTFTNACPQTWTSSLCFPLLVESWDREVRQTIPPETPTKILSPDIAFQRACERQVSFSDLSNRLASSPRTGTMRDIRRGPW
jgi:NADPH:quinone reductase-like Zn-dependent oxidoreductase/SAM-dependent methyltransferase